MGVNFVFIGVANHVAKETPENTVGGVKSDDVDAAKVLILSLLIEE